MRCSWLRHWNAIFSPQLNSCVRTKHTSWFQFCWLLERLYHSPWHGISHSYTQPSYKHWRCAVVLGEKEPTTIKKSQKTLPWLLTIQVFYYTAPAQTKILCLNTLGMELPLEDINTKQLFSLLDEQLSILLHFITLQLHHSQLGPSYCSSRHMYTKVGDWSNTERCSKSVTY